MAVLAGMLGSSSKSTIVLGFGFGVASLMRAH